MEKEVAQAVEVLRKAMVDADHSTLERLTAAELSYGHASGVVEDKASFIASIISAKNDYQSIELSDETVKAGGDIAIARHQFKAEVLIEGNPATAHLSVMQIWQKHPGGWKLLARQAFKV